LRLIFADAGKTFPAQAKIAALRLIPLRDYPDTRGSIFHD